MLAALVGTAKTQLPKPTAVQEAREVVGQPLICHQLIHDLPSRLTRAAPKFTAPDRN
jgi:hypothetical protein